MVKAFTKEIINNFATFHVNLSECAINQFQLDETKEMEEITEQEIIEEYQKQNNNI